MRELEWHHESQQKTLTLSRAKGKRINLPENANLRQRLLASNICGMNDDVLNSWKEIAAYTGRGVRTVQRWEQELRFPVRRPRGKHRSAVIAFKREIDAWLHSPRVQEAGPAKHITPEVHARLLRNTEELLARTAVLLATSDRINKQVARSLEIANLRANALVLRANTRKALELAQQIPGGDIPVKTVSA